MFEKILRKPVENNRGDYIFTYFFLFFSFWGDFPKNVGEIRWNFLMEMEIH